MNNDAAASHGSESKVQYPNPKSIFQYQLRSGLCRCPKERLDWFHISISIYLSSYTFLSLSHLTHFFLSLILHISFSTTDDALLIHHPRIPPRGSLGIFLYLRFALLARFRFVFVFYPCWQMPARPPPPHPAVMRLVGNDTLAHNSAKRVYCDMHDLPIRMGTITYLPTGMGWDGMGWSGGETHACITEGWIRELQLQLPLGLFDSVIGQAKGCSQSQSQSKDRTRAKAARTEPNRTSEA